ncbi:MAG: glycosyltransferase family 4 protein [Burkholderiaceae bacterium]|nr:glycosyltransferase family 4 protein [Burkholderiaceae bacterium]MEB2350088.1 glycosyltransferase family 4 protein [Burkholderiaceae bacterium]
MKILHVDPDDVDNPLSGGGPVRTLEICRRLAERHEITVLTPTFPGSTPEKMRDGVRYVRLGRRVGEHGSSHHLTFFVALHREIRRRRFDLLVEDFMPPMAVTFTPLLYRGPHIASVQWFMADEWSRRLRLPFFLGERYGIRMYRNFIVLTQQMKQLIEARHPRARCRIVPNGVDPALFALPVATGDFILYIGRIEFEQKGLDLLMQAYARMPRALRPRLVVAGSGNDTDRLRTLVGELGIGDSVELAGRVGPARRAQLLASCRFVAVPSRQETFGMTITEACAAGKRVVAFDAWPMNEVAPADACILVRPFDIDAYAIAMTALAQASVDTMHQAGGRCREFARRFDWDSAAALQEAFYLDVVRGPARSRQEGMAA